MLSLLWFLFPHKLSKWDVCDVDSIFNIQRRDFSVTWAQWLLCIASSLHRNEMLAVSILGPVCFTLLNSSAMDKSVLLALLCLQAFLLITAFTSSDAAALVKNDHGQLPSNQVRRFTSGHWLRGAFPFLLWLVFCVQSA